MSTHTLFRIPYILYTKEGKKNVFLPDFKETIYVKKKDDVEDCIKNFFDRKVSQMKKDELEEKIESLRVRKNGEKPEIAIPKNILLSYHPEKKTVLHRIKI